MTQDLVVSELFGPTWQGEGPSLGQRASFIRLGGCNLRCVWCDTPYTWDWERYDPKTELTRMSFSEVLVRMLDLDSDNRLWVITGGEPMLQQKSLIDFFRFLESQNAMPQRIEIETAGTIMPEIDWRVGVNYNVSPKLSHSGNPAEKRLKWPVLIELAKRNATFKFVVRHDTIENAVSDLVEVGMFVKGASIPKHRVWIMPEGITPEAVQHLGYLTEEVLDRGWNLTTRLQVILWGNKRGV